MPRIQAATVAEHVAEQEARVFDAAVRLFIERGYDHVTLADIAAEVGLARNSLYRYFPDKAGILARWAHRELTERVRRSEELVAGGGDVAERLSRWLDASLDYAGTPQHALVAQVLAVFPDLDDDMRAELADSHRRLAEPLDGLLREAGIDDAGDRRVVADLLQRFVVAGAESQAATGRREAVRSRVLAAVGALLPS